MSAPDHVTIIRWLQDRLREYGACIDGGKCHHGCKKDPEAQCFRQDGCLPLSGSGLTSDWKIPAATEGDQAKPAGPSTGQLAKHVGARETPEGWILFGSWMAVAAFRKHSDDALLDLLKDPATVHAAMLRGQIGRPDPRTMLHVHGQDAIATWDAGVCAQASREAKNWMDFEHIRDMPAVDEAIQALLADSTGDNAACVVRAVLEAAGIPVANAVRPTGQVTVRRSMPAWISVAERQPDYQGDDSRRVLVLTPNHEFGGVQVHDIRASDFDVFDPEDMEADVGTEVTQVATHWVWRDDVMAAAKQGATA